MHNLRLVIVLSLTGLLVIFAVQNAEVVSIRFLSWEMSMSRALMLFLVFATGLVAGFAFAMRLRSTKRQVKTDAPTLVPVEADDDDR